MWSKTIPSEPAFYWYKTRTQMRPEPCEVRAELQRGGTYQAFAVIGSEDSDLDQRDADFGGYEFGPRIEPLKEAP